MPTINISVYLKDEQMKKYLENQEEIKEAAKEFLKSKLEE
jgi:ABC-type proline/glycine betaine transport system substrate-binding protein|tara:strand:+ start:54 stop:173 length:120 start_codon:yes stop_codon:yes gene_type:complete